MWSLWSFGHLSFSIWKTHFLLTIIKNIFLYYSDDFDRIRFRFWQMTKMTTQLSINKLQLSDNQIDEYKMQHRPNQKTGQNLLIRRAIPLDFYQKKPCFSSIFSKKACLIPSFFSFFTSISCWFLWDSKMKGNVREPQRILHTFAASFKKVHYATMKSSLLCIEFIINSLRIPHEYASNSSWILSPSVAVWNVGLL